MMAAGCAAQRGKRVLLLEKNKDLGEKLKLTGGGRCNITNAEYDIKKILKHFGKAEQFLYSTFSQFSAKDTFEFFESRNLPLVIETHKRAFPKSQKAYDVLRVMEKYISNKNVTIRKNSPVKKIMAKDGLITCVVTKEATYTADSYVLATGGTAYPKTGSTGDGFKWLKGIGHCVESPNPNIVPLSVKDKWVKDLSGVSLSFMKITFYLNGEKAFSKTGKILFTHFGLSGPLILNSAHRVADLLRAGVVTAEIDAFPDTSLGAFEKRILKIFNTNKNKAYRNIVKEIAPDGMADTLIGFSIIPDALTKVHSISKEERKAIARLMKSFPVAIKGLMGMDRAIVSDGGVVLKEVDTKTMRSRLYRNLYLTGDLISANRPSGGYSLQLCWSTGFVAGKNV